MKNKLAADGGIDVMFSGDSSTHGIDDSADKGVFAAALITDKDGIVRRFVRRCSRWRGTGLRKSRKHFWICVSGSALVSARIHSNRER